MPFVFITITKAASQLCLLPRVSLCSTICNAKLGLADTILGNWAVYDNNTGLILGMLAAKKSKNGTYFFINKKTNSKKSRQFEDLEVCDKCPAPFAGKKIGGMVTVWNIKPVAGKAGSYEVLYGTDFKLGKLFQGTMKSNKDADELRARATPLAISLLYQALVWHRIK